MRLHRAAPSHRKKAEKNAACGPPTSGRVIGRSRRGNIWIIHVSRRPGEPYGSIRRWSISAWFEEAASNPFPSHRIAQAGRCTHCTLPDMPTTCGSRSPRRGFWTPTARAAFIAAEVVADADTFLFAAEHTGQLETSRRRGSSGRKRGHPWLRRPRTEAPKREPVGTSFLSAATDGPSGAGGNAQT